MSIHSKHAKLLWHRDVFLGAKAGNNRLSCDRRPPVKHFNGAPPPAVTTRLQMSSCEIRWHVLTDRWTSPSQRCCVLDSTHANEPCARRPLRTPLYCNALLDFTLSFQLAAAPLSEHLCVFLQLAIYLCTDCTQWAQNFLRGIFLADIRSSSSYATAFWIRVIIGKK